MTRDPSWTECVVMVAGLGIAVGLGHWWPIAAALLLAMLVEVVARARRIG